MTSPELKTIAQQGDALVILGSARDESNTLKAIQAHPLFKDAPILFLHQKQIYPYTYNSDSRKNDDFLSIAEQMTQARAIVFATPVYWYSMSGVMKIFFDRLTELITTSKPLGRALKGKDIFVVATGSDPEPPEGFEVPFRKTAEYFDMKFQRIDYVQA